MPAAGLNHVRIDGARMGQAAAQYTQLRNSCAFPPAPGRQVKELMPVQGG